MPRLGSGPVPARIMLVGDCFSEEDLRTGEPFSGPAGQELNRMLHEAGIMRSECYCTNLVNDRPRYSDFGNWLALKKKDVTREHREFHGQMVLPIVEAGYHSLLNEIKMVQPNVILALGNWPLWALTGAIGVRKWRGSQLKTSEGVKCISAYHPDYIKMDWASRAITVNDFKRAKKELRTRTYDNVPAWNFHVRPNFTSVMAGLTDLFNLAQKREYWLDFDLETRAGHIACAGISWSLTEALCIPLMCVESQEGYWSIQEESAIIYMLYRLLTHKNVKVRGQNLLYDAQYTYRHWHFVPNVAQDTMISHHTIWAGLPKRLDFQASMYCNHYVYWKDDGKTWNKNVGEDQLWSYNCEDCVRTREVGEVTLAAIEHYGLQEVEAFQQALFWPVLQAMQRGVKMDQKAKAAFAFELQEEMSKREAFLTKVLGHTLNPSSPTQMAKLFYGDLNVPPIMSRAKKGAPAHVTCDDEALEKLKVKEPLLRPIIKVIQEYRTLGVYLSTFVLAKLDHDSRMRCSYNICGTETYRLSSSKNAFNSGANLQNIPEIESMRVQDEHETDRLSLPNIRKLFVPDTGYTFFDLDLDRADLHVVVWEADDKDLKEVLRRGIDMHCYSACDIFDIKGIPMDELAETHPNYKERRGQIGEAKRNKAKKGVHAVDYYVQARTLAVHLGTTVKEAQKFIDKWLSSHPAIKRWHERTQHQLNVAGGHRFVQNAFGYRRYYFDRPEHLLPEALAWVPQSTVANVIDRVWLNFYKNLPEVQVLLQVHDSLGGQYPTHREELCLSRMKEEAQIVVPYDEPLIIPMGIKTSKESWGAVK